MPLKEKEEEEEGRECAVCVGRRNWATVVIQYNLSRCFVIIIAGLKLFVLLLLFSIKNGNNNSLALGERLALK